MTSDIVFNQVSIAKMLLHAARYPQMAVNGVVLAPTKVQDEDLNIMDAIPLFHNQLGLAPMLEIALTQIEQRYKAEGLVIAGYYQANEHLKDNVPNFIAMQIAEKIAENNSDSCLIMIDNSRMGLNLATAPIIVSRPIGEGKWKTKEKTSVHIELGSLALTSQLLQKKIQHEINDFDNHLDDLTCDWTNANINKLLALESR